MPPEPLVTAVVVNLDGRRQLHDCLDSLFAQSWPRLEVVLVDNGSSSKEVEELRELYGDRVRLILNPHNEGFARGNNQAFEVARGDWIFVLNNDAVADPGCVEALMRFAAEREEVGMLACRVVQHDRPNFLDSAGLLLYPDGACRPRGWEEKDLGQYDRAEEVLAPHGCAAAYRRSMLDALGGFDEDYFCYLEDLDLGARAWLAGWTGWYVPDARVSHRKSSTAGNYSKFKAYHVERNRIFNAVKLLPRFILFMSPLFTLNRYLLQGYAAATHRGLSDSFVKEYSYAELAWLLVKAYAVALFRLPRMLGKRRAIARSRKLSTDEWYQLISRFKLDAIELALKH